MGTINKKMFYTPDMDPSSSLRAELDMIDTLAAMDLGRHLLDYMDTLAQEIRASVNRELMIIIREVIDILSDHTTDDFTKVDLIVDVFNERGIHCGGCHDFAVPPKGRE